MRSALKKINPQNIWIVFLGGTAVLAGILACSSILPQPQPAYPTEDPYLEIPRVGLEESKAAFDRHEAIFVDVRSAASFARGHIPGALSIPISELESRIDELDPDQWIITYCT